MAVIKTARDLKKALKEISDPEQAKKEKAYLKLKRPLYGVPVPQVDKIAKRWIKDNHPDLPEAFAVVTELSDSRNFTENLLGLKILSHLSDEITSKEWKFLDKLVEKCDTWALTDEMLHILGPVVAKDRKKIKDLISWAKSKNKWRRRTAIITTIYFSHYSNSDPDAVFMVANKIVKDEDEMVQKGLAWALRDTMKVTPGPVIDYIDHHKHLIPRSVLKEATRKLPAEIRDKILEGSSKGIKGGRS